MFVHFLLLIFFIWINNTNLLISVDVERPLLLAHRGLAQTFEIKGVKWNTDTSKIIHVPEHDYLENTIRSMKKAFELGADIVEFDVRLTKDKQLAVFHDFMLDRTNGKGLVAEHTWEQLQKLDIGYGYTADNGKSFPFRGKGVSLMPRVEQVFSTFPDKELLVHVKDNDIEAGKSLHRVLVTLSKPQLEKLTIYGEDIPIRYLREKYPQMKMLSMALIKKAFLMYELVGWTGYVPDAMRNMQLHLPLKYAQLLWGWPYKFLNRMNHVNTRVVLVNGDGSGPSTGFDSSVDLERLPKNYWGAIWTNRIDKIAPVILHGK